MEVTYSILYTLNCVRAIHEEDVQILYLIGLVKEPVYYLTLRPIVTFATGGRMESG